MYSIGEKLTEYLKFFFFFLQASVVSVAILTKMLGFNKGFSQPVTVRKKKL